MAKTWKKDKDKKGEEGVNKSNDNGVGRLRIDSYALRQLIKSFTYIVLNGALLLFLIRINYVYNFCIFQYKKQRCLPNAYLINGLPEKSRFNYYSGYACSY